MRTERDAESRGAHEEVLEFHCAVVVRISLHHRVERLVAQLKACNELPLDRVIYSYVHT